MTALPLMVKSAARLMEKDRSARSLLEEVWVVPEKSRIARRWHQAAGPIGRAAPLLGALIQVGACTAETVTLMTLVTVRPAVSVIVAVNP